MSRTWTAPIKQVLGMLVLLGAGLGAASAAAADDQPVIRLRAHGVPAEFAFGPGQEADREVVEAFRRKYPWIEPVSTVGLTIPGGSRTENMVPFMQIAGDIAPDVMYVNFKQSQTYIDMQLLYPLDRYVERLAGVELPDGSSMPTAQYIEALSRGSGWPVVEDRVPEQCWQVMRRHCPFDAECPYRRDWNLPAAEDHQHVWTFPIGPLVMGLMYDRTLFAENAHAGIEQRAPRDWEELLEWAKVLTHPRRSQFGFRMTLEVPSWQFLSFLYSAGGEVVREDEQGNWYCVLDSEEAVEAAYFFARLRLERIERDGQIYRGVVGSASAVGAQARFGMEFTYLDDRFLAAAADQTKGIGPAPAGPTGLRRSEFNAMMCAVFAGLAHDQRRRDAAWSYIEFYDGVQARQIRTEKMVEAGLGPFVRRRLLEAFNFHGRYDSVLRQVSPDLEQTYAIAFEGGVPEPYGRNCQYVYEEMNKPIGAIWNSPIVRDAIDRNDPETAKAEIRAILQRATARINEKMLGHLPPETRRQRNLVAWVVIALVLGIFALTMRKVFQAFTQPGMPRRGNWQFARYAWAYLLMLPAIGSILLWMYWPMVQGTIIAFQDYNVMGTSRWVGAGNFADVLYNPEFWYSMRVSLIYALLFLVFGFWVPIGLAFLLQEVPTHKTLFRTIYYLPAVLSGVVVIFLWKSFYGPDGLINQLLNGFIGMINVLPGVELARVHQNWLDHPEMALFFTLLPTVWAGMGPGCLIYLAALKTVPEEMYEAADLDGAGIWRKVFGVAVPSIRALIMINFIGAMIGAVRGAASYILAMTGGGPFGEHGGATEVVGLKIFYTTFGYLQFGAGAAMAWVLGSMLIGFAVLQLQRLSRLEFRTAGEAR